MFVSHGKRKYLTFCNNSSLSLQRIKMFLIELPNHDSSNYNQKNQIFFLFYEHEWVNYSNSSPFQNDVKRSHIGTVWGKKVNKVRWFSFCHFHHTVWYHMVSSFFFFQTVKHLWVADIIRALNTMQNCSISIYLTDALSCTNLPCLLAKRKKKRIQGMCSSLFCVRIRDHVWSITNPSHALFSRSHSVKYTGLVRGAGREQLHVEVANGNQCRWESFHLPPAISLWAYAFVSSCCNFCLWAPSFVGAGLSGITQGTVLISGRDMICRRVLHSILTQERRENGDIWRMWPFTVPWVLSFFLIHKNIWTTA